MGQALLVTMILAGAAFLAVADAGSVAPAYAEECTGENCPPKDGMGSSGHDCEKKNEETVS